MGSGVRARMHVLPGGRFAFDALPRGRYTLRVGGDGLTSETEVPDIEAGTRDVVIHIRERR